MNLLILDHYPATPSKRSKVMRIAKAKRAKWRTLDLKILFSGSL
jgi:hypothetical protein